MRSCLRLQRQDKLKDRADGFELLQRGHDQLTDETSPKAHTVAFCACCGPTSSNTTSVAMLVRSPPIDKLKVKAGVCISWHLGNPDYPIGYLPSHLRIC